MSLPIYKTDDKDLTLLQSTWSTAINPVLSLPFNNGVILSNISLSTGSNTINHTLGRKLQGWIITRLSASCQLYDTQATNPMPALTLQLVASAPTIVNLLVF